ncbi:TIGR02536 family ethanolamine utilization protein [Clostridium algidicarnis]|uniref:TIGR02536 family ethanolamine utilization protein n=1 Tax=Clostridium algidicarnis TaxID=37659 RepID=UPI001C0D6F3B|nr:TIGR02536 family ethanolamine utilization protein [Clostridium algidicarnis]MBU3209967.1 TIGR02536 family ethanolamine utilization protein [Clostridium algidicarnis]
MNNDNLVDMITREVMKRINVIIETSSTSKKAVLILEDTKNLCPIVKGRIDQNEMSVDYIDTMKDVDSYEIILIQNLSNNELVNISKGYGNSPKEKVIIDMLLKGKKLYALEKGLQYKEHEDKSPKALLEVFEGYKNKLVSFGIEFKSLGAILGNTKENNKIEVLRSPLVKESCKIEKSDNNKCLSSVLNKKLISESDIKNLKKEGLKEILICKGSIVTPLAKDFARINNIDIKIEG